MNSLNVKRKTKKSCLRKEKDKDLIVAANIFMLKKLKISLSKVTMLTLTVECSLKKSLKEEIENVSLLKWWMSLVVLLAVICTKTLK